MKFSMCIDIVEIWFGIADGQISIIFDRVFCLRHVHIFVSGRKLEYISMDSTKLGMCIDLVEICFVCLVLLMDNFHQFWTKLSACKSSAFSSGR